MGSNPADNDGFLRATKIHRITSIRGEVKPLVLFCNISQHVKEPYEYERDTS
jgi:hypothetical protein